MKLTIISQKRKTSTSLIFQAKESGSLKGSPRPFIRYEYSESKNQIIEGTHFYFAIFSETNQLVSKLNEGPKGFYL